MAKEPVSFTEEDESHTSNEKEEAGSEWVHYGTDTRYERNEEINSESEDSMHCADPGRVTEVVEEHAVDEEDKERNNLESSCKNPLSTFAPWLEERRNVW